MRVIYVYVNGQTLDWRITAVLSCNIWNTFRWVKFGGIYTKQEIFTQMTNIIIMYVADVVLKDFTNTVRALREEEQNTGTTHFNLQ